MNEKLTTYVEVTASITMSKSLCVEVPEGATKEDVLELARKEFILPHHGIRYLEGILAQVGVRVEDIDELEYVTDYEPERIDNDNGSGCEAVTTGISEQTSTGA